MAIPTPILPILDRFGRRHSNLRISVTDRCNIRCIYCMPAESVQFQPREELLRFEEISRFVRAVAPLGINKLRITGGEPLVRSGLDQLIAQLATIPGIDDIGMTTNGMLLADHAEKLQAAGLQRLNISLDCLDDETFFRISRRRGVARILEGIEAARALPYHKIRLNAVILPGINEHQILDLARFAKDRELELRFIEFMPLNAAGAWDQDHVVSGRDIREQIDRELGPLRRAPATDPSQPARDYLYPSGLRVGFVDSVTEPFCSTCNRIRLTADGKLRNCLFSDEAWDVRSLLRRSDLSDADMVALVRECVAAKWAGHQIHSESFVKPASAMHQIGG